MKSIWKDFRTNMMYWRFRHITRNRLRLRSWWSRRRPAARLSRPAQPFYSGPARGTATYAYRNSQRETWTILLSMVVLLTALKVLVDHVWVVNSGLVYLIGLLIIFGAVYTALRRG